MRASAAPDWLRCPVKAMWQEKQRREGRKSVALEMGDRIHAGVTGHVPTPGRVQYDGKTRSPREAVRQHEEAVDRVHQWLQRNFWQIWGSEIEVKARVRWGSVAVVVEGHIDMVLESQQGTRIIVDLKTGLRRPTRSWPQVSVYALLWQVTRKETLDAGLLWVPRGKGDVSLAIRSGGDLCRMGYSVLYDRAEVAVKGARARPGMDCAMCGVEGCAVRESWEVYERKDGGTYD